MVPSRPSGEFPDPGDSGDFGVTDLSGDLGGSRDREAVPRMDLLRHWRITVCPRCDVQIGGGGHCWECGSRGVKPVPRSVEVEVVPAPTRGAVSPDTADFQTWTTVYPDGHPKAGQPVDVVTGEYATAAVESLRQQLRGAVDAERHAEVLAEMVKYRAQLATAVEERDAARREVAERQLEERTR